MSFVEHAPITHPTRISLRDALAVLYPENEVNNASRWQVISNVMGDGKPIVFVRKQEVALSDALDKVIRARNPELIKTLDEARLHGASAKVMEWWINENSSKFREVSVEIGELAQTLNLPKPSGISF